MKREKLKELGLSDEQIESVIGLHGKTLIDINSQLKTAQDEAKQYQAQLASRDRDLKKLQKDNGDNEALKTQISDLQQQYKDLEKSSAEKLVAIQRESALNNLLAEAKVKNPKAVAALLDRDKIVFKDGELSGAKEQVEALQKSDSYLFDLGKKQGGYNPPAGSASTNYASFEEAMEKGDIDGFLRQQVEESEEE